MSMESKNPRVLCLIPARNCQQSLPRVFADFYGEILDYIEEILVIDNASTDETFQVAKDELKKLKSIKGTVFQNIRNYGLGGSHKIAFKYASEAGFDYLMVVHGDGSASVNDFLTVFNEENYQNYDLILSNRLSPFHQRTHYPFHRLWVNRLLSAFATLVTGQLIKDFSGGPLNFYRVSAFVSEKEDAIRRFSNDVALPQNMILHGVFRKYRLRYFPVNLHEQDRKPWNKLISQFGKSVLLLVNFLFRPQKCVNEVVYGTIDTPSYRGFSTKIGTPKIAKRIVFPPSLSLIDLRSKVSDRYIKTFQHVSLEGIGTSELWDQSYLNLKIKFDVETVSSLGLKANLLKLFKVYSPDKIILDINADEVLASKQFLEFMEFCDSFGLNTHLISTKSNHLVLCEMYAPFLKQMTLNYEFKADTSTDFYNHAVQIAKVVPHLNVNVLSHPNNFDDCCNLYQQLNQNKYVDSIHFQPYLATNSEVNDSGPQQMTIDRSETKVNFSLLARRHRYFPRDSKNFTNVHEFGFTDVIPLRDYISVKTMEINHQGEITLSKNGEDIPLGSLFDETSSWLSKMVGTV